MKATNQTIKYYSFIDFFRGIAVLWVLVHHIRIIVDFSHFSLLPFFSPIVFRIVKLGYLGVDMFFVASGFLITSILIEGWENPIRLKRFYLQRVVRILPLYFITILVGFFLYYLLNRHIFRFEDSFSLLGYFLFIQNYFIKIPPLLHTWSLAVEVHFYLLYSFLVFLVFYFIADAGKRRKQLIIICWVIIGVINFKRIFFLLL